MKQIELVILIVAIILLYIQPHVLIQYANTMVGRAIMLIILVLASLYSVMSGIVVAMVMVVFVDAHCDCHKHHYGDAIYEGMQDRQFGISPDTLKQGSVSQDLLESSTETSRLSQNLLENTKSGASIIGDTPAKPVGSAVTDLKGTSASSITFSNVPSTANFRKNHCRSTPGSSAQVFVDEKGKILKMADIKKKYPLNFTNGIECNPCDETCSYTITDGGEQLHNEENLRPKQASMFL
jgi:hypothetical protein